MDIQNAGDGSGRLFIVEKPGRILILKGGQLLPTPFLDISAKVGSRYTEQGLLGLAFHPDYARSGLFFVNYTDGNGNTVIARFHVSADDPNLADPASEVDILHVDQPYNNHNGGGLAFGPDGYLYIGLGDGGSEGDPLLTGQNLHTLLGKMLRIDVDHGSRMQSRPTIPLPKAAGCRRSGHMGCATRGVFPSTVSPAICTSQMSARMPGKRSISCLPERPAA